jgi:hypothetical protein
LAAVRGPNAIVTQAGRTLTPATELFIAHMRLLTAGIDADHADGSVPNRDAVAQPLGLGICLT